MMDFYDKKLQQRYLVLRLALDSRHCGFTRRDAAIDLGCYELASRIGELEAEGVEFDRTRERGKNRYGYNVNYTRYTLRHCPPVLKAFILSVNP